MQQFIAREYFPSSEEKMTDPFKGNHPDTRKYVGSGEDCCLNYAELNNLTDVSYTLEEEECTS